MLAVYELPIVLPAEAAVFPQCCVELKKAAGDRDMAILARIQGIENLPGITER